MVVFLGFLSNMTLLMCALPSLRAHVRVVWRRDMQMMITYLAYKNDAVNHNLVLAVYSPLLASQ
jgi:hypothetical protein